MISWGRGHLKTTNKQCTLLDIYSGSGLKGTYLPFFALISKSDNGVLMIL